MTLMGSLRRVSLAARCVPLAAVLALLVTACSDDGLSAAERSRATSLPSPTKPGVETTRILADRVRTLLSSSVVSADEDLVVDGTETATRLGWKDRGAVVGASVLTIGTSRPGVAVFRSPRAFVSRATGSGERCWAAAEPSSARYDRPTVPEIDLLKSARATRGNGSLITGSVSARAALRLLGTDEDLRRRALLPPDGVRVPAGFGTTDPGLSVTLRWSDLVAAAGGSSRHDRHGTWMLRFLPDGTAGPAAPPAAQVVSLPRSDPSFGSALRACNARLQ